MSASGTHVPRHEQIRLVLLERITSGVWPPGAAIPSEAELAREFGVSRPTIGRAMRDLAAGGIVERRRRAGSRVAVREAREATLRIPILRLEIEDRGGRYAHLLLERREAVPPPVVGALFGPDILALHLRALHFEDGRTHALEDRWINLRAVPEAAQQDFDTESANEWLVRHVPYTRLEQILSATAAGAEDAEALEVAEGAPLFRIERTTWRGAEALTRVRLVHRADGFRIVARHSV